MDIYHAIMPTVSMFKDFHNRKPTISNEDFRQNFHHGDGRGGACVHVQRLGGWVGSHALFGLITLFGVMGNDSFDSYKG